MLLSITTTHSPATDLGYLLHKSPERLQTFELAFGQAHVFYPKASEERCTACLLVEVDPVRLVRKERGDNGVTFAYVNDRPYASSSLLSTAISRVLGTAMGGRSAQRPELAATAIPLEARLPAMSCRGGESLLRAYFEPLGYTVTAREVPLAPEFPEWGGSRYFDVALSAAVRLSDLLKHLYVLIPALDGDKHYWIGTDEVDKLLAKGEGWLAEHPERKSITARYLGRRGKLVGQALERLLDVDAAAQELDAEEEPVPPVRAERSKSLNDLRMAAVVDALKTSGAKRVLDLGCGEGKLLVRLAQDVQYQEILGVDVASRRVQDAQRALERLPERLRQRVTVAQGSLLYSDSRLAGWDAAVLVEVIEHIEPDRLPVLEQTVFGHAAPRTVVVTTPNRDFNPNYEGLAAGATRHADHRFEWGQAEFTAWAEAVASRYGYAIRLSGIGETVEGSGAPTQMAVFER